MAKLVVLITAQVNAGHQVGEAWQQAGAPGVTFIESYGIQKMRETSQNAEVLPGMLSMIDILRQNEETNLIALSLLHEDSLVQKLLDEAQRILGDLLTPNAGVVFVIDVERAMGIRVHSRE